MPFEAQGSDPRAYWMREGSAVLLTDDLLALKAAPISRDDRLRAFEPDLLLTAEASGIAPALAVALAPLSGFADVSDDPESPFDVSAFFVSPFDELEDSASAFPFDE